MEHWAKRYQEAESGSLEGKIYRAACYIHRSHEREALAREIGRVAFEQNVCIWHAASMVQKQVETCPCAPCMKARGKPNTVSMG